jgi:hypothetical protein
VTLRLLPAAGYLATMTAWIYGVVEPSRGYGSDAAAVFGLCALLLLHVATGLAIARGWAALLPAALPLIAYPAGWADGDELLIWEFYAIYVTPIAALVILAGVALRHVVGGRKAQAA